MAEEEEDILEDMWEAIVGHPVEVTDRLTKAVILEPSKLVISTVVP
jgi:hypothetical protein